MWWFFTRIDTEVSRKSVIETLSSCSHVTGRDVNSPLCCSGKFKVKHIQATPLLLPVGLFNTNSLNMLLCFICASTCYHLIKSKKHRARLTVAVHYRFQGHFPNTGSRNSRGVKLSTLQWVQTYVCHAICWMLQKKSLPDSLCSWDVILIVNINFKRKNPAIKQSDQCSPGSQGFGVAGDHPDGHSSHGHLFRFVVAPTDSHTFSKILCCPFREIYYN